MSLSIVEKTLYLVQSEDPILKVLGARDIRRLTKSSLRYRRQFSDAVKPLVDMLRSTSFEFIEAALLALLNLSVKDEGNKKSIIDAGALEPIIGFLQSENVSLQNYATASLLTLSASSVTKPILSSFGVIPLLVDILRRGSSQAKVNAILTLYNLSTYQGNLTLILETEPIPYIVSLLKSCKKSSKAAEKCTALIESLMCYEEGRNALTSEEGGIFAIVEVLEIGSLQSREHAVGALLTMCQIDRCKYRELILREGVMPGLLELTVKGTAKSQEKSQTLLRLLRETPYKRSELKPDTLENIVSNLIYQLDGNEQTEKARGLLAEVIQVSMDQSLRHLHQREMVFTPVDLSVPSGASEISST
ncbi:PREDICTED: U-box domain-containing protein 4-like [Nicotiana attenuata]|uniref:U-box domain-containing protein 4 n=1 Tax=Nicotiana attenuata TaxID=49451 RepID=A0A1J6KQW4_NICAT|nr:PREDICTED: U-box domain-containing protein 4-like [Nicotiana attenuata]OIT27232.1 u-box domain-containing protein 4 [Nicotiana attenuata]